MWFISSSPITDCLQPLKVHCHIASLAIFYFHVHCSLELSDFMFPQPCCIRFLFQVELSCVVAILLHLAEEDVVRWLAWKVTRRYIYKIYVQGLHGAWTEEGKRDSAVLVSHPVESDLICLHRFLMRLSIFTFITKDNCSPDIYAT